MLPPPPVMWWSQTEGDSFALLALPFPPFFVVEAWGLGQRERETLSPSSSPRSFLAGREREREREAADFIIGGAYKEAKKIKETFFQTQRGEDNY